MKTKQEPQFLKLHRLPGVPDSESDAVHVRSVTDAISRLKEGHFVTTAGSNGSLTVWRDSDEMYRCEFDIFGRPKSEKSYKYLAAVHQWLKDWWPKLGRTRKDV